MEERKPALVFISHSSKTPDSVEVRDAVVAALHSATKPAQHRLFEPRIDRGTISPGDAWWRTIVNTWIMQCHAAIVVISDEALHSRTYVGYEMSILIERWLAGSCGHSRAQRPEPERRCLAPAGARRERVGESILCKSDPRCECELFIVGLYVSDIRSLRLHLVRAFGSRRGVLAEIEDPSWRTYETMDEIRRCLRAQVGVENDHDLMKRLRVSRGGVPVFIAIWMSHLSPAVMTMLRDELPEMTCLVILE